jgi:hypothetical protein
MGEIFNGSTWTSPTGNAMEGSAHAFVHQGCEDTRTSLAQEAFAQKRQTGPVSQAFEQSQTGLVQQSFEQSQTNNTWQNIAAECMAGAIRGAIAGALLTEICADNKSLLDKLPDDVKKELKDLGVNDVSVTKDGGTMHVTMKLDNEKYKDTGNADAPQLWLDKQVKFDASIDGKKINISNLEGVGIKVNPGRWSPYVWVYPTAAKIEPTDGGAKATVTVKKLGVSTDRDVDLPKETYDAIMNTAKSIDK